MRRRETAERGEEPALIGAKTIASAMEVLRLFTYAAEEWTVPDIARALHLTYSTAYRYVTTLEAADFLVRQPRTGTYRVGLPVIELAGVALNQLEVRVQGLVYLDHLADTTGMNANLAMLNQADVVHIGYAVRSAVGRMYTALGRRAAAHCTALGKTLLAALPFEDVRRRIEMRGWRSYTPHSIQNFPDLERALLEVRTQGYAIDCGERRLGTSCIAAPIYDRTGDVVAAISVTGPNAVVTEDRMPDLIRAVVEHANTISYRLGYDEVYPHAVVHLPKETGAGERVRAAGQ